MQKNTLQHLPPFSFPVVAWAPKPATDDPCDDGTRSFLTPTDVVTNYFAEKDLRLGWTFADAGGRCWEAVSSRVAGRADPWWMRSLPEWLHHPRYWLAMEFEERPAVSFDAVKSRLFLSVTANPKAYPSEYRRDRMAELRSARSLSDLIMSDEDWAIRRLGHEPIGWQWMTGDGRCSRRAFLAAWAVCAVMLWIDLALRIQMPWFLALFIVSFSIALSSIVRRLHDVGLSAWWMLTWFGLSFLCAQVHDGLDHAAVKRGAALVWRCATLAVLGFLALAPGMRKANRYGFARGQTAPSPAASSV